VDTSNIFHIKYEVNSTCFRSHSKGQFMYDYEYLRLHLPSFSGTYTDVSSVFKTMPSDEERRNFAHYVKKVKRKGENGIEL
jgi:hypothetical protein